ncbi:integrase [Pelagibacterium montanilacus]|uniref:integrase n=1 Tax=Pelagibacterium montanilacus TaxID=2185280 RepID=UPI000F8E2345|nr:integrase [Pelagibacterium montanilacus]
MRKSGDARPHKRDGVWYLVRRVPKEFAHLDKRNPVKVSTEIAVADDPRGVRAKAVVRQLSAELEAYWRGLREGQAAEAHRRYEAARKRARSLNVSYQPAGILAEGSVDEIVKRVQLLLDRSALDDGDEVAAVLGGESKPTLRLSGLLEAVEENQSTALDKYSPNQLRRWRNAKKLAIKNLISVVGDKTLADITRADALEYRHYWQARVMAGGVRVDTANKDIGHLTQMFGSVDRLALTDVRSKFTGMLLEGGGYEQRAPFDPSFVRDVIFAPGALDGLNPEARAIIWVVASTGMRPVEVCHVYPEHVHLDAEVPYVQVRPVERVLKTDHSARDIPLVGTALAAFKLFPGGFPRYRDKNASFSATANKYMGDHGMRPTDGHSVYSLRHTFEDQLTGLEAPEKVVASLMGHKWIRPKYGAGPSLKQKARWMKRIAFQQPRQG